MTGRNLAIWAVLLATPALTLAGQWKPCGWGGGGLYWACAFHPAKKGVIYLGGDVNGFYKSTDHGKRWKIRNKGLCDYAVYSMAVDPRNPDQVYVGTPSGTCASRDAGESWEFLAATGTGRLAITAVRHRSVRALAVDPGNGDIYAGTPSGMIFHSKDGGVSWRKLHDLKGNGGVSSVTVSTGRRRLLLAATEKNGLLMSRDSGETWTRLATPDAVNHAVAAGNLIYAACAKDGVWKSRDLGKTWSRAGTGINPDCDMREVVVDPGSPKTVCVIGNVGWGGYFYRSRNGGKTWTESRQLAVDKIGNPTLPDEPDVAAGTTILSMLTNLALNPNDPEELYVSGNWRTGHSSDGGKTWEERDAGADITCVTDIRFLDGETYVTAMDEGLLMSPDNGASWRQLVPRKWTREISGHQWRVLAWKDAAGKAKIVSTDSPWDSPGNTVLVSDDGGESFIQVRQGLPEARPRTNVMWGDGYARALAQDPRNRNVLYLGIDGDPEPGKENTGGGIFKSADGGRTWGRLPSQPDSRRMFYGLAVDPTNPDRIFWGGSADKGGLYRSEDGGGTWKHVFKQEGWIFNVAVSSAGAVYCPGTNLWRSLDHGATWEKITNFADGLQIVGLAVHPHDENTLWLSRVTWSDRVAGGVLKTRDGGDTWTDITGDLPHRKPLVLRFNPKTSELWAGGAGLYRIKQ